MNGIFRTLTKLTPGKICKMHISKSIAVQSVRYHIASGNPKSYIPNGNRNRKIGLTPLITCLSTSRLQDMKITPVSQIKGCCAQVRPALSLLNSPVRPASPVSLYLRISPRRVTACKPRVAWFCMLKPKVRFHEIVKSQNSKP